MVHKTIAFTLIVLFFFLGCISSPTDNRPIVDTRRVPSDCRIISNQMERDKCFAEVAPKVATQNTVEALSLCYSIGTTHLKDACFNIVAPFIAKTKPGVALDACKEIVDKRRKETCYSNIINKAPLKNKPLLYIEAKPFSFLLNFFILVFILLAVYHFYMRLIEKSFESQKFIPVLAAEPTQKIETAPAIPEYPAQQETNNVELVGTPYNSFSRGSYGKYYSQVNFYGYGQVYTHSDETELEDRLWKKRKEKRKREHEKKKKERDNHIKNVTISDEKGFHEITVIE